MFNFFQTFLKYMATGILNIRTDIDLVLIWVWVDFFSISWNLNTSFIPSFHLSILPFILPSFHPIIFHPWKFRSFTKWQNYMYKINFTHMNPISLSVFKCLILFIYLKVFERYLTFFCKFPYLSLLDNAFWKCQNDLNPLYSYHIIYRISQMTRILPYISKRLTDG